MDRITEKITVTVSWIAPEGTFVALRNGADDGPITQAAADLVAARSDALLFVSVNKEDLRQ